MTSTFHPQSLELDPGILTLVLSSFPLMPSQLSFFMHLSVPSTRGGGRGLVQAKGGNFDIF